MRSDGLLASVVVAAAGTLLVGCSSVTGSPITGSSSSSSAPTNMYGAPHVGRPLVVDKFIKDPCSAIPPAQLQQLAEKYRLGTKAAYYKSPAALAECTYHRVGYNINVGQGRVSFLAGNGGLSAPYSSRKDASVFQPATVAGYPAVHLVIGEPSNSDCEITVGLSDRQAVFLSFSADNIDIPRQQQCVVVDAMAAVVVQTIKESQ